MTDRNSKGLILFSILITSFVNPFLGAAINIALPAISEEFSLGAVAMSWVSMAFLLSSAVFLVPFGKLADIHGRKRIFFIGNVIIALTSLLCALSFSGPMINYATTFAITFLLNLYLLYILELSPRNAGIVLITRPDIMAVVASVSGKLSDRYDPRILASIGMAVIVAGLVLFSLLTVHSSIRFLVGILVIVGFGFGMFSSPNTNAIMGSVDRKFLGVDSAAWVSWPPWPGVNPDRNRRENPAPFCNIQ